MHDGPPLAVLILTVSWIPILALKSLIKEFRGKDGGSKRASSTEIEQLKAQVAALNEQVEQLRHTATGFDLSFDKRLSEIELQARLSKLSDVSASETLRQGGHP
ncbi:MAG: hypothetical protein ACOVP2_00160 [Armatimonadaceae bacterium]